MKLEGLGKLNRRLDAIADQRAMLRRIQIAAVAEAKRIVPRKTSTLGRSITPGSLTDTYAIVAATAPYAAFVELGTKPHRIPKTGNAKRPMPIGMSKRLSGRSRAGSGRKYTGKGGMPSHAWHVNHPGTKAQPYLVPAARLALKKAGIRQIVQRWNDAA